MVIALLDQQNECNFAIKFEDETQKEKVKELMKAGLSCWYEAAHEIILDNEYFTAEEIKSMYGDGYAEPTMELLERNNIKAECVDIKYDDDDYVINADEVIYV